jgi:hypothetical protein
MRAARTAMLALSLALSAGCGAEVPAGGAGAMPRVPEGPRVARQVDAPDLLPKDLDLVVRVDLARMRSGLGPDATKQLSARAVALSPGSADQEAILATALGRAEVVWVGMRLTDVESGDRVVVAEGRLAGLAPEPGGPDWNQQKTAIADVFVYDRATPPPRAGTARIVAVGDRILAFVSPVQVAAVDRVLRNGPDEGRGDPAAEGIFSVDLRARPLPWLLARRFKHIADILEGLVDDGAKLEGEIVAKSSESADKAMKFLAILRDNVQDPKYVELMSKAKLERVGKRVQLKWEVPARAVLGMVSGGGGSAPADDTPEASPPPARKPAAPAPAGKPAAPAASAPARRFE